jgi:hypothetical protein
MSAASGRRRGIPPFTWFGVGVILASGWGILMGLAYYNVPTFTVAALPTVAGEMIAVAAFVLIAVLAPANE